MAGHMSFVFALFVISALSLAILGADVLTDDTKDFFKDVDKNNDDRMSAEEITAHASTFDVNKDGKINIHEFSSGFKPFFPDDNKEDNAIGGFFTQLQRSGQILINNLSNEVIALMDTDDNDLMTLQELTAYLTRKENGAD